MSNLFVIMPFGTKHVDGEAIDFDQIYTTMIRPAAKDANWEVLRIDEVVAVGAINEQYLKEILTADLVLAEISSPNANVFYELGIRHAISPRGTLLVARTNTVIPFDLSSHRVLMYEATPDGMKAGREQIELTLAHHTTNPADNPAWGILQRLALIPDPATDPVAFERDLDARIDRAASTDDLRAIWALIRDISHLPVRSLRRLSDRLSSAGDWDAAAHVLTRAAELEPEDAGIHRQLGWYLSHLGENRSPEALAAFNRALSINPADSETYGMLGGRAKRLGNFDEARTWYRQGVELAPGDPYMLINLAAIEIIAKPHAPEEGVNDYRRLIVLLKERQNAPDEWYELNLGEAYFAGGDDESAQEHYELARSLASSPKSLESAADQLQVFADRGFRPQAARSFMEMLNRGVATRREPPISRRPTRACPVLIHLSDLHFGQQDGKSVHRFDADPSRLSLADQLYEEFGGKLRQLSFDNSSLYLVVSGDLTWNGSPSEFAQASTCLASFCDRIELSRERVSFVPGNHDVSWHLSKDDPASRFNNYLGFLAVFYGNDLVAERYPDLGWPVVVGQTPPRPDQIVGMAVYEEHGLLVATLNSCVYEDDQRHYGFVGEPQVRRLRELLKPIDRHEELVRVAVIHHHMHPFREYLQIDRSEVWNDLSTVLDAGFLESVLERLGFDLVLHGHKHKPQTRETLLRDVGPQKQDARPLIVCGAGTVSCLELEQAHANHYELVQVLQNPRRPNVPFVRVRWRELSQVAGAEWTDTESYDVYG
jgi:tetratricopeptide (TPR) repeat protein